MNTRICSLCSTKKTLKSSPWEANSRQDGNPAANPASQKCIVIGMKETKQPKEKMPTNTGLNIGRSCGSMRGLIYPPMWRHLPNGERCNEADPVVLEFHHVGEKENDVSVLIGRGSSLEALIAEINKCVVLCGNCHKRLTVRERGWFRGKKWFPNIAGYCYIGGLTKFQA